MPTGPAYPSYSGVIPPAQREKINRGILNLIRAGQAPDKAKVFAGYTGKGGLHGLTYRDFANRHAYSEAKRSIEQGQFFTPDVVVAAIAAFLNVSDTDDVADLTCGAGAFANHCRGRFFGLEIDADAATVASYLYPEARIITGDLRAWTSKGKFRFCVGNPPFALRWMVPQCPMANALGEAASEDVFLWKAAESLAAGGSLCFVAPANWLTDDIVSAKALGFIGTRFERVAEVLLPSNAFANAGVAAFETKIVLFRTWLPGEEPKATTPVIVDGRQGDYSEVVQAWRAATPLYSAFRASLGGIRAELALVDQRSDRFQRAVSSTLLYRYLRLHAELGRVDENAAAAISGKWTQALAPVSYDRDGNPVSQISPETVIRQTRKALRDAWQPEKHLVRVVRTKKGVTVKTYSRAAALAVADVRFSMSNEAFADGNATLDQVAAAVAKVEAAIVDRNAVAPTRARRSESVVFEALSVGRTVRRLRRRFELWNRPLVADFNGRGRLEAALRGFYGRLASKDVRVIEKQITALAKLCAKPGGFLGWDMGVGKSLASLAWDALKREDDRSANRRSGYTLLVSSALAIELHWQDALETYAIPATRPESRADWAALMESAPAEGQAVLLVTHFQLMRCPKLMRQLVRCGVISSLIVDESDEFSNPAAARTRALAIAGREIRHKLLLTGTPVRNNAAELFAQLSLLLHGEPFFRCVAKSMIVYDARIRDFVRMENPQYLHSYTGRGGMALFRRCHAPARPTVMGAEKSVAMLPEQVALERFLACFRSRVRLRELTERDPYDRQTSTVYLGALERALYDDTARQAVAIAKAHLSAGRSERRATLLSLAHAIRLLQQTLSMPARFGYHGEPAKERELIWQIRMSTATHVAVGVIWRESVERLLPVLQREFPDRVIVAFDGADSFAQRRRKLRALEAAPRGLVLCTQGSVRSSLNLPIVGHVIAESFPWNFTSLNQFCMRFCRLTSRDVVTVTMLVCADTIEERILGLLLCKEKVAAPIAGDELDGESELYAQYGIEVDALDELARYLAERDPSLRVRPDAAAA